MSDKNKEARERAEAEVNDRIQATLANPRLVSALAELRAMTPSGERAFGFQVDAADARAEVPNPERIEPVGGAAIVSDREAASAYVDPVAPASAASPRMPTGRVRFSKQGSAASTSDPRHQTTLPSIARGGTGPRPPSIAGDIDEPTPAVLERPAVSAPLPGPRRSQEGAIRGTPPGRTWMVAALGIAFAVCLLAALVLRPRQGHAPPGVTTSPATVAPTAEPAPTASTSTAAPDTTTGPTAGVTPSGSAAPIPPAPTTSPRPTTRSPPPAATSGAGAIPPAEPASTADPAPPPAPTVAPSVAPVEPQPTSKPLIYD